MPAPKPDILIWHPTAENPDIGACLLLWSLDRTMISAQGKRTRPRAERLAADRGWAFEQGSPIRPAAGLRDAGRAPVPASATRAR